MIFDDVWAMIGNTPSIKVPEVKPATPWPVYVKLEGCNPTGSVKDRAAASMLRAALRDGSLSPGKTILDASSGNMASSLAYFGKILGFPTRLVASSKLTSDKKSFITYYGAELLQMGNFTIEGNIYCRELAAQSGSEFAFLDQLHNWNNPQAHEDATGPELLRDFSNLSVVIGSLGSGGTMYGVSKHLKARAPHVMTVTVEGAGGSRIPGVGAFVDNDYVTPFIQRGRDGGLFDRAVRVSRDEAFRSALALRDAGIFAGPQTGALYHAARSLIESGQAPPGQVVIISGDAGWKNLADLAPLGRPNAAEPAARASRPRATLPQVVAE